MASLKRILLPIAESPVKKSRRAHVQKEDERFTNISLCADIPSVYLEPVRYEDIPEECWSDAQHSFDCVCKLCIFDGSALIQFQKRHCSCVKCITGR